MKAKSSIVPAEAAAPEAVYTRLHITPFSPDLVKVVVPPSVLPRAKNISYHSIQTFPERRFGFVDLPVAEADRIKKKLQGAVLKGTKIRVEVARSDDMPQPSGESPSGDISSGKGKKSKKEDEKKRKRGAQEVVGVELEEGRRVKRGWTAPEETKSRKDKAKRGKDSKDKRDKKDRKEAKSKYTDGPECLVKTILPRNVASDAIEAGKGKRTKGKSREVVVHEFEKTTKFPTFLKTPAEPGHSASSLEFAEGKGWVDESGSIVQPVRTRAAVAAQIHKQTAEKVSVDQADEETSSSGSSSDDEDNDVGSEPETSVDGTDAQHINESTSRQANNVDKTFNLDSPRPKSSGSGRSLTIKIPPATPAAVKIHPLEALYKRKKQEDGTPGQNTEPGVKGFSFFGADDDLEEGPDEPAPASQPPMTPFTRQEFEWRNVRSAAPTPDTAHPNRTFKLWPRDEGQEDIEEEDNDEDMIEAQSVEAAGEGEGEGEADSSQPASKDFQKWFWENRGDLNRSWKKRRKQAAKEKRYRENRSRAERAI